MEYIVKIHADSGILEKSIEAGSNVLDLLQKQSFDLNSHCSGKGTCGKCSVKISGELKPPCEEEKKLLGSRKLTEGYRLACYCSVNSNIEIFLENDKASNASILTEGRENKINIRPLVSKECLQITQGTIENQTSDADRIKPLGGKFSIEDSLELLRKIPVLLSESNSEITVCLKGTEIIEIEAGNTTDKFYGIAVDIGTTTIAAYLYCLNSGRRISVKSSLNPQKRFGADVISRIEYSSRSIENNNEISRTLIKGINTLISDLVDESNITYNDLYEAVCVGNTSMLHFLMNISAEKIAVAPFLPVTTDMHNFKASSLGININPSGCVVLLPCVSAYIGADTISAVLASRMFEDEEVSLLVDIGTNGEMVLGCKEWMLSCSTAAGPAFEGANINNGTGGIEGAIDKVYIENELKYKTIGNKSPVGICGSGVIDTVAVMLEAGVVDETGRIIDPEEMEYSVPIDMKDRVIASDGKKVFIVEKRINTRTNEDIVLTQKDIREVQNAKAAIAAGIKTLARHAGIGHDEIKKVYLAGGFGNHMNMNSAVKIGLIPTELEKKIEFIGNAAGMGAAECLLSEELLEVTLRIKKQIKYIELSADKNFSEDYIESMIF